VKAGLARPLNKATNAAAAGHAGIGRHQTCAMVNINMTWHHPKYYAELRRLGRELASSKVTSAQAPTRKRPNPEPKAQASSQSQQAQESDDQGTSAQAHDQMYKQQG